MLPWLSDRHGNPSSSHKYGREAFAAVELAREQVAYLIGAEAADIVFVGSGSEAANTVVDSFAVPGGRLAVSAFEHPAVLAAAERHRDLEVEVDYVRPDQRGVCRVTDWESALAARPSMAALMLANNEVGTLQPVAQVAAACHEQEVPILCDAVQAIGKIEVRVEELEVDYLVLAGHKFHGPLGAAALWVRPGAHLRPFLVGGGQERSRRASTVNVPAVVGLGRACQLANDELAQRTESLGGLRDRFERRIVAMDGVTVHGREAPRLPNTSSVAFDGVAAQALMIRLDMAGFAVSMGSACGSGKVEPSATLRAMGVNENLAASTLRFSFGMTNDEGEVDELCSAVETAVAELRLKRAAG